MKSSELRRYGFDVVVAPATTAGAYSAGAIIGGLMTFSVSRVNNEPVLLSGAQVILKAAVTPNLTLHLFNTNLPNTTKGDTNAFSLNAADAFAHVKAIPFGPMGAVWNSLGTPKEIELDNLGLMTKPASGAKTLFGLLVTATAVTLTSTSDAQVRLRGEGA